jgi:hypothetical protein
MSMAKAQLLKSHPKKHSITSWSASRQFLRLFMHRHFPLDKKQSLPKRDAPRSSSSTEEAYHKIHRESEGRLALSEGGYTGDDRRHLLYCHDCGHHIMASFDEIQAGQLDQDDKVSVCPHCMGDRFLERFTTLRDIQVYCLEVSFHCAYFLGWNRLGGTMEEMRNWYCLVHRAPYQASMQQFLGDSHGCPGCTKDARARDRP